MPDEFRQQLVAGGFLSPGARLVPMTGGVSSDIYRVEGNGSPHPELVVKRALGKLRVEAEWRADVARNRYEVAYLERVRKIVPDEVPKVLFHDPERGYFGMELLGPEYENWKERMLGGRCEVRSAESAGSVLGKIHGATWGDRELEREFDTTRNFFDLRLEPYLLATAERHPELADLLTAEAERIRASRQCLVHGDFSPKNLLFHGDRMMILDCEVAWFGDAAFDVSFLLNHLFIKALHLRDHRPACLEMAATAWAHYRAQARRKEVGPAVARLLPMLMLARVDGKSPLEYLGEAEKDAIRRFAPEVIRSPRGSVASLLGSWAAFLEDIA